MTLIPVSLLRAARAQNPTTNAPSLDKAFTKWEVNTPWRIKCALANTLHESGGLSIFDEDMYYTSATHVYDVFRSHFAGLNDASNYIKNAEKLGNRVYAALGGYAYRGAGWPQITGMSNFRAFGIAVGITDVTKVRAYLDTPDGSADAVGWYFKTHGCAAYADAGDLVSVRNVWEGMRPHNASVQGMKDTQMWFDRVNAAMTPQGAPSVPVVRPVTQPDACATNNDTSADALNNAQLLKGPTDA